MDLANISMCINGLLLMPNKALNGSWHLSALSHQWVLLLKPKLSCKYFLRSMLQKQTIWQNFVISLQMFDYKWRSISYQIKYNTIIITRFSLFKSRAVFTLTSEHTESGGGCDLACRVRSVAFINSFISWGSQWLDPQD